MSYAVYHIKSTQLIKSFSTESGAKRSVTCMNRNAKAIKYAYADSDTYQTKIVFKNKVRNLLSGKEIEIDSNTPLCCDPSSETYHCM